MTASCGRAGASPGSQKQINVTRRAIVLGPAAALLASCAGGRDRRQEGEQGSEQFDPAEMYAATTDHGISIPAVDLRKVRPDMYRRWVSTPVDAQPGTISVCLAECHLHLLLPNGRTIRYGIGIGREGFSWTGTGTVARVGAWPRWTPPPEMVARSPELAAYRNGMAGGIGNPLGARALYIYSGGRDTLYRIHGTPEWWSIGRAMSSGCIRMLNQDVIDLAARIRPGTTVTVA